MAAPKTSSINRGTSQNAAANSANMKIQKATSNASHPHHHSMPGALPAGEEGAAISPFFALTDECKHYTHISQVDWDIQK